jgi:hypothetical protein
MGKNMMVGEAKPDLRGKELTREVAYEKTPDGRETFKITVKDSGHGGQGSSTPSGQQATEPVLDRAVRPGVQGGQTAPAHGYPKMLIRSGPRQETGSSTWQRIREAFQSEKSHLICFLTSILDKRSLQVINR